MVLLLAHFNPKKRAKIYFLLGVPVQHRKEVDVVSISQRLSNPSLANVWTLVGDLATTSFAAPMLSVTGLLVRSSGGVTMIWLYDEQLGCPFNGNLISKS